MRKIFAHKTVSISELRVNPSAVLTAAKAEPVAILNRNKLAGYIISPAVWEGIMDQLDDVNLATTANARLNDGQQTMKVSLDNL